MILLLSVSWSLASHIISADDGRIASETTQTVDKQKPFTTEFSSTGERPERRGPPHLDKTSIKTFSADVMNMVLALSLAS
jgi:hypothetical protein